MSEEATQGIKGRTRGRERGSCGKSLHCDILGKEYVRQRAALGLALGTWGCLHVPGTWPWNDYGWVTRPGGRGPIRHVGWGGVG